MTKKPAAPQSPLSSSVLEQCLRDLESHGDANVTLTRSGIGAIAKVFRSTLIARRVNQCPAFDAMVAALEKACACHSDGQVWYHVPELRAALKLAQEVK